MWARWAGIAVQGLVLGTLLFLALVRLLGEAGTARLFRYEGF